jgi:hypothetical protein
MKKNIIYSILLMVFSTTILSNEVNVEWGVSSESKNIFFNSNGDLKGFTKKYKSTDDDFENYNNKVIGENYKKNKVVKESPKNDKLIYAKKVNDEKAIEQELIKVFGSCVPQEDESLEWICFNAFYLNAFEVTNAHYREFNPNYNNQNPNLNGNNQPVIGLSLKNIQNYIDWISQETGEQHRLPTSAEWKYAALAGEKFTDLSCDIANIQGCNSSTLSIGSYKANNWGFYDMYGNAAEVTSNNTIEGDSWNGMDDNSIGFRLVVDE